MDEARERPGRLEVLVLGSCELVLDGRRLPLSGVQRRLLARVALAAPVPAGLDQLAEAVWGDDAPRTARAALQNQVSRLRAIAGEDVVTTAAGGYVLGTSTDADEVSRWVVAAESALGEGDADEAHWMADAALDRWRGAPYDELDHLEDVASARRVLGELRVAAERIRLEAALRMGRLAWAVPEAERLVAASPYDEHRWALLVRTLDLAGRRGDALAAVDRARVALRDGLGLRPGPELRAAEASVLGIRVGRVGAVATRCLGRNAEIAELLGVVGSGGRAFVVGEEGVGKSQLLHELAGRLRRGGAAVAATRCQASPATAVTVLVDLAEELGVVIEPGRGPVEGFVAGVATAASHRPVTLVVDDLHLAGPSSRLALDEASALPGVALVAATAEAPPEGAGDLVVRVPPLSAEVVALLVADLLGGAAPAPAPSVDWLVEMSGGNPLLLEHLLADPALEQPEPTESLADVVRRRIERLGSVSRAAIDIAAVCGVECPTSLLDELAPAPGLAAAIAAGLLDRDASRTRFRHGAVQRIAYLDVPTGRRIEIHHAAGMALRRSGHPSTAVAEHLLAAVDLDPAAAAGAAEEAALEASGHGAHRDAVQWYQRMADAASAMGDAGRRRLVAARIGAGDELRLAGDPRHEEALFAAAEEAQATGEPDLIGAAAYALLQLGATTASGTSHERAVAFADRALDVVTDAEQRAVVAGAASLALSMSGEADRCRALFLQAEAGASGSATRRLVLPFAYLGLGFVGDLDRREELTDELLALADAADDPVARFEGQHLAFSVALQRGHGDRLRSSVAEMAALVDRVGDVGRRWSLGYAQSTIAHLDGELERCERLAEETMSLFAPVSSSRAFAVYGSQLLVLRVSQGRVAELAEVAAGLVADQPGVPAWHAALALAAGAADPALGREQARLALEGVPRDFTWLAAHVTGGRAAASTGAADLVEVYRERLRPWSGLVCWQGNCSFGPVDTVLAALARAAGDAAGVREHVRRAREVVRRLGAPVYEGELDELDA